MLCPRSQFFKIRTDPKPVNNLFIFFKLSNEKKTHGRGLEYGLKPQAEGTVFPNTDRPKPANNVFIFSLWKITSYKIFVLIFY